MNYNDFTKETIDIFTLVTGPYTAFFEKFLKSLHNFFPDNKKIVHISSDGLDEYNGKCFIEDKIEKIIVNHIVDLPFPLIPIQKTYMQINYGKNTRYIFYFDIDTVFLEQSKETWEFLFEKINEDNIIFSKHPHHDSCPENVPYLVEYNAESKAYIPEDYNGHIISSFWGGKTNEVLKMDKYVNDKLKYDLRIIRYLPAFVDENYINRIIWETKKGMCKDLHFYCAEHFITIPESNFIVDTPHIFLLQKYDTSIKNSKKDVQ